MVKKNNKNEDVNLDDLFKQARRHELAKQDGEEEPEEEDT